MTREATPIERDWVFARRFVVRRMIERGDPTAADRIPDIPEVGALQDQIERLSVAAREVLDASAGIMGAYQTWLHDGNSAAAERLDRFDAAWANLHRLINGAGGRS